MGARINMSEKEAIERGYLKPKEAPKKVVPKTEIGLYRPTRRRVYPGYGVPMVRASRITFTHALVFIAGWMFGFIVGLLFK